MRLNHPPDETENPLIQLTRIRHEEPFFLNPDFFERVDSHVDTVVRLTDGTEYVVTERAEEIVRRIVEFRARIIVIASKLGSGPIPESWSNTEGQSKVPMGELTPATTGFEEQS